MHDYDFNSYIQLRTWKIDYISKSSEKNPSACAPWKFWRGAHKKVRGAALPAPLIFPTLYIIYTIVSSHACLQTGSLLLLVNLLTVKIRQHWNLSSLCNGKYKSEHARSLKGLRKENSNLRYIFISSGLRKSIIINSFKSRQKRI